MKKARPRKPPFSIAVNGVGKKNIGFCLSLAPIRRVPWWKRLAVCDSWKCELPSVPAVPGGEDGSMPGWRKRWRECRRWFIFTWGWDGP